MKKEIKQTLFLQRDKENYLAYVKRQDGKDMEFFNSEWLISKDGYVVNAIADVGFEPYQLFANDFIRNYMSRKWFNANTFLPVLFEVARRTNVNEVSILL